MVYITIERVQDNKEVFQIIADDATDHIVAIWCKQEKSNNPKKWISPPVWVLVWNLKTIAKRQAIRNMVARVLAYVSDASQIRQTREMIDTAVMRFQVHFNIEMNGLFLEVAARQKELFRRYEKFRTPRVEEEEEEELEEEEEVENLEKEEEEEAW